MGLREEGAKKEATKVEPLKGMIIYSDGGVRPNPGFAGWGIHGYMYAAAKPKKGSGNADHYLVNRGYVTKEEVAKAGYDFKEYSNEEFLAAHYTASSIPLEVTPIHYVNGFGAMPYITTNNVAELHAAINAMKHALDYDVNVLDIWTDSQYVCKGTEQWVPGWIRNNWMRPPTKENNFESKEVANKKDWLELIALRKQLTDCGTQVRLNWVRGHNDHLGNTTADHAATAAVMLATRNGTSFNKEGQKFSMMNVDKADGYWKYDSERHPFIANPRMYYNTHPDLQKTGEYYFGNHGKDDDLIGKRMSDGAYAVVLLDTPDPILELVRAFSCRQAMGSDSIVFARLDQLYNPTIHREISLFEENALVSAKTTGLNLESLGREPLVTDVDPPRLVTRVVDCVEDMLVTLKKFVDKHPSIITTDITGILYETAEKPDKKTGEFVMQLKPEYNVGFASMEVEANYQGKEAVEQAPVTLTLSIDLLGRNSLKRLESTNPKVTLITWLEADDAFRYATVIQSGKDIGIWAGYYSNLRIVTK